MARLILGRRALWASYAVCVLAFSLATRTDLGRLPAEEAGIHTVLDATISAAIFLLIAIVVDRSVAALRESLAESRQKRKELDEANERLREEIAERERAEQQLVHAQRMKAIGRLASGVAHDFNNVLGVVLGYAARRHGVTDTDTALSLLAGIEKAASRGSAIANRLLTLARPDAARPEVFDASQATRDAMPLLRQLFDDDVRIDAQVPETPLPVRFDRSQLELVLLNIAANARDAMPEGGRFQVVLNEASRSDWLELMLNDTGTGMDQNTQRHVFEPFHTAKPPGQGYGLGLATVKSLITEAGGSIKVVSEQSKGTSIRIRLPLARDSSSRAVPVDDSSERLRDRQPQSA